MFSRGVHAIFFAFVVGGLVGYGIATTQALSNPEAAAQVRSSPDTRQVAITSPSLDVPRPPSKDIQNNAGIPFTPPPSPTPTATYSTEPPVTQVLPPTDEPTPSETMTP